MGRLGVHPGGSGGGGGGVRRTFPPRRGGVRDVVFHGDEAQEVGLLLQRAASVATFTCEGEEGGRGRESAIKNKPPTKALSSCTER